jgi:hypothetical protein
MSPKPEFKKPKVIKLIQIALSKKLQFARSEFYRVLDESSQSTQPTYILPENLEEKKFSNSKPIGWLVEPSRGEIVPIEDGVSYLGLTELEGLKLLPRSDFPGALRAQVLGDLLKIDSVDVDGPRWSLHSNEILSQFGRNYVVKLLPKKIQNLARMSGNISRLVCLVGLGLWFTAVNFEKLIWAEDSHFKSNINAFKTSDENGKVSINLALTYPPKDVVQFQAFDSKGKKLGLEQDKLPVRLWVLSDVSTQCVPKKIGTFTNMTLSAIQDSLHPSSRVSVATYSSNGSEIQLSNASVKGLKGVKVRCQSQYLSSDFGAVLSALAQKEGASSLPTFVWVLTSGNVHLNEEAIQWIKKLDLKVHLYLYNPALLEPVRANYEELTQTLGKDYFQVTALDSEAQVEGLLENYHQVRILTPFVLAGTHQKFKILGLSDKKEFSQGFIEAEVPTRVYRHTIQKYAYTIIVGIVLVVLIGFITFLIWYFKPKSCPQCQRWVRKVQGDCLFCSEMEQAVLIKKENARTLSSRYLEVGAVFVLKGEKTQFGSHSQSPIRFKKNQEEIARPFFEIQTIKTQSNQSAFRLKRLVPQHLLDIQVNQINVQEERLLAAGDRIIIRNTELIFYTLGSKNEDAVYS